jgi:hypothetical protein
MENRNNVIKEKTPGHVNVPLLSDRPRRWSADDCDEEFSDVSIDSRSDKEKQLDQYHWLVKLMNGIVVTDKQIHEAVAGMKDAAGKNDSSMSLYREGIMTRLETLHELIDEYSTTAIAFGQKDSGENDDADSSPDQPMRAFAIPIDTLTPEDIQIHVGAEEDYSEQPKEVLYFYRDAAGKIVNYSKIIHNNRIENEFLLDGNSDLAIPASLGGSDLFYGIPDLYIGYNIAKDGIHLQPCPVVIFEQEKLANRFKYHFSGVVFLATGSKEPVTREKASVLKGRQVLVAFDDMAEPEERLEEFVKTINAAGGEAQLVPLSLLLNCLDDMGTLTGLMGIYLGDFTIGRPTRKTDSIPWKTNQ